MKKNLLLFVLFFFIIPMVYAVSCNPDSIVYDDNQEYLYNCCDVYADGSSNCLDWCIVITG